MAIQKRPYGDTGEQLSIIGFGGIVVKDRDQRDADRDVQAAFDRGVNYFDVAPSYGDAEVKLGPALTSTKLRDKIFLACKTGKRDKSGAASELRQSLAHLQTDRFDLFQLHAVSSVDEARQCLAPGGAMEAVVEARDAGLIRYIGFSAHSAEAALLLLEEFAFDSILFPFNYTTFHAGNFGPQVLQKAIEKGAARLALKGMARQPWPADADRSTVPNAWYEPHLIPADAERALRWTLSLPVTAAIPPGDPRLFNWALDFAERFTPLSAQENEEVAAGAGAFTPLFTAPG